MTDVQVESFEAPEEGEFQDETPIEQEADQAHEEGADDAADARKHDEAESRKIALKRERTRARNAERRADELAARLARLEQGQGQGQAKPDPFAALQSAKDPLSEIDALKAIAQSMAAQQQDQARQTQVERQQQAQIKAIADTMGEYEADFREEKPDYDKAMDYFRADYAAELQEQGYSGDELRRKMQADLLGMVQRTVAQGKDPAETAYKLAVKRGYGVDKTSDKIDKIKRGIAAGSSIGRAGAAPPKGPISVESVARSKKSGAEFMKDFQALRKQMTSQAGR